MSDTSDHSAKDMEVYKQQSARFCNVNDAFYKIPPIFSTVIGGLWFFAAGQIHHQRWVAFGVFAFAAATGLAGANCLVQLRKTINGYLDRLNSFEGAYAFTLKDIPTP